MNSDGTTTLVPNYRLIVILIVAPRLPDSLIVTPLLNVPLLEIGKVNEPVVENVPDGRFNVLEPEFPRLSVAVPLCELLQGKGNEKVPLP